MRSPFYLLDMTALRLSPPLFFGLHLLQILQSPGEFFRLGSSDRRHGYWGATEQRIGLRDLGYKNQQLKGTLPTRRTSDTLPTRTSLRRNHAFDINGLPRSGLP
jgi:hypothetical protein